MLSKTLKSAIVDDVPYEVLYDDIKEYISDLSGKSFVLEEDSNGCRLFGKGAVSDS